MHPTPRLLLASIVFATFLFAARPGLAAELPHGTVATEHLASTILRDNLIGIEANRLVKIYLPPGYAESDRRYPVLYYLHNTFWSPEKMFEDGNLVRLLDHGIAGHTIRPFIFVAADFSSPTTGSLYENSPVSGRWLDYLTQEVVPFIDARFRTLARPESRAVAGDFFGGRGALKLGMTHPEIFSVVYALHPVATGTGAIPWPRVGVDWKRIYAAKSFADVGSDGRTRIFVAISQAFAPNPNRPPFYCDWFMEPDAHGEPRLNPDRVLQIKAGFLLEESLAECAANLRRLRGLAFDWGRFDPTRDHVYSNRQFSRKLEDLGIDHEAEEYRGDPWDRTWTADGRFATRLLPFLDRHLVFALKH